MEILSNNCKSNFPLFHRQILFLSSDYLMSLLSTVPGWCSSSIIVPDCSSDDVRHVVEIAEKGWTESDKYQTFSDDGFLEAVKLILGLNVKDFTRNVILKIEIETTNSVSKCTSAIESEKHMIEKDASNIENKVTVDFSEWDHWMESLVRGEKKDKKDLQCHVCDYKARDNYQLKEHVRYHHDKIFDHVCKICGSKAINNSALKMHVKSLHLNVKYPCDKCTLEFRNPSILSHHKKKEHEQIRYPCLQCDVKLSTKKELKRHTEVRHLGVKYRCDKCGHEVSTKINLKKHILVKHEGVRYPCNQCHFKGSDPSSLKVHIKTQHQNIGLNCDLCESIFPSKYNLRMHRTKVHNADFDDIF